METNTTSSSDITKQLNAQGIALVKQGSVVEAKDAWIKALQIILAETMIVCDEESSEDLAYFSSSSDDDYDDDTEMEEEENSVTFDSCYSDMHAAAAATTRTSDCSIIPPQMLAYSTPLAARQQSDERRNSTSTSSTWGSESDDSNNNNACCPVSVVVQSGDVCSIYNRMWQIPSSKLPLQAEHQAAAIFFNLALMHHRTALYTAALAASNAKQQPSSYCCWEQAFKYYQQCYELLQVEWTAATCQYHVWWLLLLRAAVCYNLVHVLTAFVGGNPTTLPSSNTALISSLILELRMLQQQTASYSYSTATAAATFASTTPSAKYPTANPQEQPPLQDDDEDEVDIEFLQKHIFSLSLLGQGEPPVHSNSSR